MPLIDVYYEITKGKIQPLPEEESYVITSQINSEMRDFRRDIKRKFFLSELAAKEIILRSKNP